jgi:hypothetical protein
LVAVVLLLPRSALSSQELSPEAFATILKKILAYDKALSGSPRIDLAYEKDYPGQAQELAKALEKIGLSSSLVPLAELSSPQRAPVVVVLAPAMPARVHDYLARERVLSVSFQVGQAERGEVSVALGLRPDGKPEIVVNLKQLQNEGHSFSSGLLGLSRVIR